MCFTAYFCSTFSPITHYFPIDFPFFSFRLSPICLLRFLISTCIISPSDAIITLTHFFLVLVDVNKFHLFCRVQILPYWAICTGRECLSVNTEKLVHALGIKLCSQKRLEPPCLLSAQLILLTSEFLQSSRNQ